ncbi:hypothetical protein G6F65_021994 [Rhizopus arrhizus]|uniref:Uncharacterized protein n=1 Tax=Rhizopus delemar TaxID=936053 RepID=A0A9P6Y8D9_9FUNG|nr:hypothetical protein G6F65_021994 [Rhizopus arrhizus]KAG1389643.1 hypothetical protein G6F58_013228 [Rhizopus delemar]KAG1541956.1 hypothetical protein G6F50_014164 [Rhizopus delemar]
MHEEFGGDGACRLRSHTVYLGHPKIRLVRIRVALFGGRDVVQGEHLQLKQLVQPVKVQRIAQRAPVLCNDDDGAAARQSGPAPGVSERRQRL